MKSDSVLMFSAGGTTRLRYVQNSADRAATSTFQSRDIAVSGSRVITVPQRQLLQYYWFVVNPL